MKMQILSAVHISIAYRNASLQKCCHEEVKMILRLVRRLDGIILITLIDTLENDAAAELFERFGRF